MNKNPEIYWIVNRSDKKIGILTCQSICPQDDQYNTDSKLHVYNSTKRNLKQIDEEKIK